MSAVRELNLSTAARGTGTTPGRRVVQGEVAASFGKSLDAVDRIPVIGVDLVDDHEVHTHLYTPQVVRSRAKKRKVDTDDVRWAEQKRRALGVPE